jgi:hypothetical protein
MEQYNVNVYKIWYDDAPDDFYIGSTKLTLGKRMTCHRSDCRRGRNSKIYNTMREKGINAFKYVLVDSKMVTCSDEQRKFEQKYMAELKPTLNSYRAFRTREDFLLQRRISDKRRSINPTRKRNIRASGKKQRNTLEYKQYQIEYRKTYNATPEYKEDARVRSRQRYANKKFARELHDFIHS